MSSLHSKMAKGAAWMVLFKLLERSIGLFSMLFLARILMPADFGIVSIATATIAILEVLGSFSFDIALIQRKDCDRTHYDTAWTFNVIVGLLASVLVVTLAQPAASFYNEPRLKDLLYLLALSPLVGSLENIGIVAFRKEMQFHKEFVFLISKRLIATVLTLILAVTLRSYWALALGILIGRTVGTLLSYILNSYRPKLSLSKRNELMSFSAWSFSTNILQFASNRIGDFIIGKSNGPASLGIYNVAYEISNLPTTELVAPINRAVFPAYAKMGTEELKAGYLLVLESVGFIAIPAALGITSIADILVPTLLGNKWLEAIPLIKMLCFYGMMQALTSNVGSVYYALGIPKTITKYYTYYVLILIPGFFIGTHYLGPQGAALSLLAATITIIPFNLRNLFNLINVRIKEFTTCIWRPTISSLMMLYLLISIKKYIYPYSKESIYYLAFLTITGMMIYILAIYALWAIVGRPEGIESRVLLRIKSIHTRELIK